MIPHYTEFIQRELNSRQEKNPKYSIRAFARDLKLAHQTLAAVLKKNHGLSVATASRIAPLLNLTSLEMKLFIYSAQAHHHRTSAGRQKALQELEKLSAQFKQKVISQNHFKTIADWEHNAILALTDFPDFSGNPTYLARHLSISEARAQKAFQRLVDLGLVVESSEGRWKRTGKVLGISSDKSSQAFQAHYQQVLSLASEKMKTIPVTERESSTVFMSLTESDYQFVLSELSAFRKKLLQEVAKRGGESDRVYCLAIQLFPVAKKNSQ